MEPKKSRSYYSMELKMLVCGLKFYNIIMRQESRQENLKRIFVELTEFNNTYIN